MPYRAGKREERRVGKPVVDVEAPLAALDETGLAQPLKVLRCVGDGEPDLAGQRLDGPIPLRQEFEKLEPMRAGERLADAGELAVEAVLEDAVGRIVAHSQVLY